MAQNITLLGASYSNVPSVQLPKTGGGTAQFDDTTISSNAATASDIASGKLAYVNGALITGTASGGGGGSSWTLLASTTMTVKTTSTSAASAGTVSAGSAAYTKDKIILVRVRDKAGPRTGYFYGSDAYFCANYLKAFGATNTLSTAARLGVMYSSSNAWANAGSSYGVYGYSIASDGTVTIRRRYNSAYGTIDGTFLVQVYALDYPDGKSPFDTGIIT